MIPASHITDFVDGLAWLVVSPCGGLHECAVSTFCRLDFEHLGQGCSGCNGIGLIDRHASGVECPGAGRHTFQIEVECSLPMCVNGTPGYWPDGDRCGHCQATGIAECWVSVVPGMVLPMFDWTGTYDPARTPAHFSLSRDGERWTQFPQGLGKTPVVDLPPAAEPGMWAVQLRKAEQ